MGVAGEEDETASPKRYLLRERRRHELAMGAAAGGAFQAEGGVSRTRKTGNSEAAPGKIAQDF